ncbi:hypothetical protein ABW19_dt0205697 [Dactylella cylindrospora]|nr:hypothetical protein ABW19_dt0205697 [Dactylella cylindrospora]
MHGMAKTERHDPSTLSHTTNQHPGRANGPLVNYPAPELNEKKKKEFKDLGSLGVSRKRMWLDTCISVQGLWHHGNPFVNVAFVHVHVPVPIRSTGIHIQLVLLSPPMNSCVTSGSHG